MPEIEPHAWDVTTAEAREIQDTYRHHIRLEDDFPDPPRTVAGIDIGFEDKNTVTRAAVVVLSFPDLELVERALVKQPTSFPYIPGYLSFREIPAALAALAQLQAQPDLVLCDGQGIAHPRRMGLASHLGVLTNLPTIGCAKSRFIGEHEEVPKKRGSWVPLMDKYERIGAVLRTRDGVKPLYISPGHRITLETAIDYVLRCTPKYRLPETTRQAHKLASNL